MELISALLLHLVILVVPMCLGCYVIYYLLTLPMRRNERALIFLSVIESGIKRGDSPENVIVSLAKDHDPCLGSRLRSLARAIELGLKLSDALEKVTGYLPAHICGMIAAGEELGDVGRVLPACRQTLTGGPSKIRAAMNYIVMLACGAFMAAPLIILMVGTVVLPRFMKIQEDLSRDLPPGQLSMTLLGRVVDNAPLITVGLWAIVLFVTLWLILYMVSPRLPSWLRVRPVTDRIAYRLPWRRKRLGCNFSSMLSLLLDSGVPESRAIMLAARGAGNIVFVERARMAVGDLAAGATLAQAVARLDGSGEFQWRIANAAHSGHGFSQALAGWHETLDARAFQQEQTTAQLITTSTVLFNGLVVGLLALGVFRFLVGIMEGFALW